MKKRRYIKEYGLVWWILVILGFAAFLFALGICGTLDFKARYGI